MNLTASEPGLGVRAWRGEYMGMRDYPLVFFADADNEADIKEFFYRTDSGEYKSTGKTEMGGINFRIAPKITGGKITLEVAQERFNSGKNKETERGRKRQDEEYSAPIYDI